MVGSALTEFTIHASAYASKAKRQYGNGGVFTHAFESRPMPRSYSEWLHSRSLSICKGPIQLSFQYRRRKRAESTSTYHLERDKFWFDSLFLNVVSHRIQEREYPRRRLSLWRAGVGSIRARVNLVDVLDVLIYGSGEF